MKGGLRTFPVRAFAPALALVLLLAAAFTVSPDPPAPGLPAWLSALAGTAGPGTMALLELLQAFAIGAFAVVTGILLFLGFRDRAERERSGRQRYSKPMRRLVLALLGILATMVVMPWAYGAYLSSILGKSASAGPSAPTGPEPAAAGTVLASPSSTETSAPGGAPPALVLALACAGAAAAVLATVLIVRSGTGGRASARGSGEDGGEEEGVPPEAAERLGRALRVLRTGDSARDAVIAAWATMCDLMIPGSPGLQAPSLTPRELESFLRRHGAPGREVAVLTRAFELARYSEETVTPELREEAILALSAIEAELVRPGTVER